MASSVTASRLCSYQVVVAVLLQLASHFATTGITFCYIHHDRAATRDGERRLFAASVVVFCYIRQRLLLHPFIFRCKRCYPQWRATTGDDDDDFFPATILRLLRPTTEKYYNGDFYLLEPVNSSARRSCIHGHVFMLEPASVSGVWTATQHQQGFCHGTAWDLRLICASSADRWQARAARVTSARGGQG